MKQEEKNGENSSTLQAAVVVSVNTALFRAIKRDTIRASIQSPFRMAHDFPGSFLETTTVLATNGTARLYNSDAKNRYFSKSVRLL